MDTVLYKLFENTPYGIIYDKFTNKKKDHEKFANKSGNPLGIIGSALVIWFVEVLIALYLLHRCTGSFNAFHVLFIIFCPCYLLCYIIYMLVAHNFCNIV